MVLNINWFKSTLIVQSGNNPAFLKAIKEMIRSNRVKEHLLLFPWTSSFDKSVVYASDSIKGVKLGEVLKNGKY
jgi:hypothetical protein